MKVARILVPIEYSDNCATALELSGRLAERLGAELVVMHVWERPSFVTEDLMVEHEELGRRTLADLVAFTAREDLRAFMQRVRLPPSVKLTTRLVSGEPAHAILEHVRSEGVDLIVVATHGRTGFRHFLMGSIAEKMVRLSPVPVLTVPPLKRLASS